MATISIRIPQIGEGLQEARLVAHLKQPGDRIRRDEPIYQMETDKAVMDVESPYDGVLVEWLGAQDEVLAIGAEVARIEVAGEVQEAPAPTHGPAGQTSEVKSPNAAIPPRTRAYAKEKGLSDSELSALASTGAKLMPADIDAYLSNKPAAAQTSNAAYEERPVGQKQRLLSSRMQRSSQLVVPGTMSVVVNWGPIERERIRVKSSGDSFQPSAFTMFAYAVARATIEHPSFRSSLSGEDTLRTYKHLALGIAVALPGDELVLAVVEEADSLNWREFAERTRDRIELARTGKDQANESVTLSLTNMQSYGLRDAVPVVVQPSAATLFLGEVYNEQDPESDEFLIRRSANIGLTFDHRIMNGVGAANFLKTVKQNVETISSILL
jgi:pyruvate dehydrogenase E2 component (dihydrolipoamide acetyltransferase)